MNFKDLLLPISFALVTTWAIQYYFFGTTPQPTDQISSGQVFIAPKTKHELKPLNTEVELMHDRRAKPVQETEVVTKGATYTFSTDGAILQRLEFNQVNKAGGGSLRTIYPLQEDNRQNSCFLLAFNRPTPYYYDLIDQKESASKVELTYQATLDHGTIQKIFTVYKDTYKMDLTVKIDSRESLDPRILFASPFVPELIKQDAISLLVNNEKGALTKITHDKINPAQGWFSPALFGAEDRYFVHALVSDPSKFVQRAYAKVAGSQIISILEGPENSGQWTLSFYLGPKEVEAFAAVDSRLEQTLDYSGILAPVSKFLLYLLKLFYQFIHNYGVAIILLALLIKLILLPFTYGAEESMQKRNEFNKKLQYLEQKHKNDPEVLKREKAELIKKHGMPGLGGCLPLVLQIPIFIALSRVLSSAIELYNAPFFGWITDLSSKDPYYVLPIATGLAMLVQAMQTPMRNTQERFSAMIMPLVFFAVTASVSAGLSLYICAFTVFGLLQTSMLKMIKRL